MEIVIRFIGIILFVTNIANNKTTYDIYLPDLAKEREIKECTDNNGLIPKAPAHTAAIRIRTPNLVPQKTWGARSCDDGVNCKLFIVAPGNSIQITGVTDQGSTVKGDLQYLQHLQDDNYFTQIVNDNDLKAKSAAYLNINNGTIESDKFSNKQGYATLFVHLASASKVTITAGPNSLEIPAAELVNFDIVNIPTIHDSETSGIPKTGGHNDFLAYYLYSAAKDICTTPTDSGMQRVSTQMTQAGHGNVKATTLRRVLLDDDGSMSPIGGNADCSSSTWP